MSNAPEAVILWVDSRVPLYAACTDLPAFFALVDRNREGRERLRKQGHADQDKRMGDAARAAYDRLKRQAEAA